MAVLSQEVAKDGLWDCEMFPNSPSLLSLDEALSGVCVDGVVCWSHLYASLLPCASSSVCALFQVCRLRLVFVACIVVRFAALCARESVRNAPDYNFLFLLSKGLCVLAVVRSQTQGNY